MSVPAPLSLSVNGRLRQLTIDADVPLLYVLRNDLGLTAAKFGCGLGQCGACAVLVDGVARRSCRLPVGKAAAHAIVTLEGLGSLDQPHPVQQAFIDSQAAQCGYCLNGMIIATAALLTRQPNPSEGDIRHSLAHHLCRCGTHLEILAAARLAAAVLAAS